MVEGFRVGRVGGGSYYLAVQGTVRPDRVYVKLGGGFNQTHRAWKCRKPWETAALRATLPH